MKLFFASQELPVSDADWFFHKCEGNGWRNGGKPILDWRATVRSWKAGGYLPSQKNSSNGNGNGSPRKPVEVSDWIKKLSRMTDDELIVKVASMQITHEQYDAATEYRKSNPPQ